MAGACAGIRVLECSRGAAGSLATMVLADFGADVIRLEPSGDGTEVTPADLLLNRGKRSVLFDASDSAYRRRLLDLVADRGRVGRGLGARRRPGLGRGR